MPQTDHPSAPWRLGNRFELLVDGEVFFPRMLAAIEAAERHVLLEMYLVESGAITDKFIAALGAAVKRGVAVMILFDDFGALGLRPGDRERLIGSGAQLRFFNRLGLAHGLRNLMRNHRKLMLVDGRVAFVGGAGITDEFAGRPGMVRAWHDVMVEIQGPVVADWQNLFAATWLMTGAKAAGPRTQASSEEMPGGMLGRVTYSAGWQRSHLADSVIEHIDHARHRVRVVSAYFVPSRRFRKALRRAVRRGVDVRVMVPGPCTDHPLARHAGRRYFGKLLRNGVKIFEYQPCVLHAKIVLCDGWVSVGSANLDRWNFKWNLEANQEIGDADFAERVAGMFEHDETECVQLDRRQWMSRHWADRLREWWAGFLDRALDRWLTRR